MRKGGNKEDWEGIEREGKRKREEKMNNMRKAMRRKERR